MDKNQYNKLLFSKLSGILSQLDSLVKDSKVEAIEENFDLFKQWLELSHLHVDLMNYHFDLGKKIHNELNPNKDDNKLNSNTNKNSIFAYMSEEDYARFKKNTK